MARPPTAGVSGTDLNRLITKYPGLAFRPDRSDPHVRATDAARVVGTIEFQTVEEPGLPKLDISYPLKLIVPRRFPAELPRVYALDGSIPKDYHTNPSGDLCLGVRVELHAIVRRDPTLLGFVDDCLVPYLYRRRHIEEFGKPPWDDLAHGAAGLLRYYERALGVKGSAVCVELLGLGGMRKRVANKVKCPCGSGLRVGRCHHRHLNALRHRCGRRVLRDACVELERCLAIDERAAH